MTKPPLEPLEMLRGGNYQPEKPPGDDLEHIFAANAVNRIGRALFGAAWVDDERGDRWRKAIECVSRAAREGVVQGYARFAGYTGIAPERWADADLVQTFRSNKISPFIVGAPGYWLFFGKRGLLALLYSLQAATEHSAPFEFDMAAPRWRLFDAAVWVATGGQATTSEALAAGLEELGCKLLFAKLAEMGFSAPKISGISPILEVRQPIMYSLLERTHTGWLGPGAGHLVRFYPQRDPEDEDGPGVTMADFRMKGHTEPSLFDLSIEREALLTLYPRIEAPKGAGGKRGPKGKPSEALIEEMKALLDSDSPPTSVHAAARMVAERNPEKNVLTESVQKRIFDAFNLKHPTYKRGYVRDE